MASGVVMEYEWWRRGGVLGRESGLRHIERKILHWCREYRLQERIESDWSR